MNDLDTLLRAADPGADTPAYTPAQRRDILSRAVAPAPKPSRRPLGWRMGAVAAATLTVVALGIGSLGGSGATARAEEVLTQAAINAVDPPAEPGQFWLISTTSTGVAEYSDPDQESGECAYKTIDLTYVSVTGESPSWFVSSAAEVASNQQPCVDSSSLRSDTFTNDIIPNQRPASWQHPSPAFLASLPRDVTQLRERLYEDSRGHGQDAHSEVFVYVADVLRSGFVPADLRSSLFGVLKSLPGIEVSEESVDAGRDVVVLGIGDAGGTHRMKLDPAGGQVVGEQYLTPQGEVRRESSVHRSLVDAIPDSVITDAVHQVCAIADDGATECRPE